MKIKVAILSLFLTLKLLAAYNIDDYILFHKGMEANEEKNYGNSELLYEVYMRNYKDSYPLTSNYAKYYIAKNYYDLGEYEKAIIYFNRAVYTPIKYIKQETLKTNYFQYKRDYYMGEIYNKLNNKEKSEEYYSRLIKDYYDPKLTEYEKYAFHILKSYDKKYEYLYEIKYENNFNNLSEISVDEISGLSSYFYEKKEYENAKKCLEYMIFYMKNSNYKIEKLYLKTLLKLKEYKKVISLTKNRDESVLILFRAKAFYGENDYSRALYNYKKLENTEYEKEAKLEMGKIYYDLGDYDEVREVIKGYSPENEEEASLLLNTYIKLRNKKNFIKEYEKFKIKYPSNYKYGVYYLIYDQITREKKNPWELENYNAFFIGNFVVRNYINSLKNSLEEENERERTLKNTLIEIGKLGNEELLDVAIKSGAFTLKNSDIQNNYIVLESLVQSGFYSKAYEYAKENANEMYLSKDSLVYLYPKYYIAEVEKGKKEYLIPDSLIYTVMNIESSFKMNFKKDNKIGLMGVEKDKNINEKFYLVPENNILLGLKKLKEYYDKYEGDNLKILLAYFYGESELEKINFELDGDINLERIKNKKDREKIENIIYTYAFYSAIYN